MNNKNMVYFIQQGHDGPIKIGSADNVKNRIAQLQTGSPQKLRLLLEFDGNSEKEFLLHKKFSQYKMKGEWFYPVKGIFDFISKCNSRIYDELNREEKEFRIWCHASCCCGETEITTAREYLLHLTQSALDAQGFGCGYFGDDDSKISLAMIEFAEWYEDILHNRYYKNEREKFFNKQDLDDNSVNCE